ncbi:sensor histidine kinase [Actinotalea ferrariae]|uniref:sensor histidine kinase n=1 Tax=Actinotalea ferrariae TaxID=1386098 RepID=UPI001C8CE4F5|nr:histidine kinase [Actinotalea ferrariae]MBX9243783.1 sensor histidine kinase [Actinotalea ferrariae]
MHWWERVGTWDDSHRLPVDALGTALLALVLVPTAGAVAYGQPSSGGLEVPITILMLAPLAWRRVWPAASAAAVYAVALIHMLMGYPMILPTDLLVLVALYSVTVHGPVWAYRTAIGGALAGSVLLGVVLLASQNSVEAAIGVAFVVSLLTSTTFAFALVRRSRRERVDSLVDRARRLEIERDQQAQLATSAERTRIAREMHDIVAHSLSVIIAQADGGRYAAATDPAAATRSLTTISETGRAALADMRRLLGVLRPEVAQAAGAGAPAGAGGAAGTGAPSSAAPQAPAVADLTPQPAVDDIAHLVEQVRSSGVRISLVRMGQDRPLPPGTGLTVYRICQESLTNVLKHAGPGPTVTVLLQWTPASLVLEVSDDGRGAAAQGGDGAGQGVLGMRERAAMLGGTVAVGPRPGGGFRVRAEIPLPPRPADAAGTSSTSSTSSTSGTNGMEETA